MPDTEADNSTQYDANALYQDVDGLAGILETLATDKIKELIPGLPGNYAAYKVELLRNAGKFVYEVCRDKEDPHAAAKAFVSVVVDAAVDKALGLPVNIGEYAAHLAAKGLEPLVEWEKKSPTYYDLWMSRLENLPPDQQLDILLDYAGDGCFATFEQTQKMLDAPHQLIGAMKEKIKTAVYDSYVTAVDGPHDPQESMPQTTSITDEGSCGDDTSLMSEGVASIQMPTLEQSYQPPRQDAPPPRVEFKPVDTDSLQARATEILSHFHVTANPQEFTITYEPKTLVDGAVAALIIASGVAYNNRKFKAKMVKETKLEQHVNATYQGINDAYSRIYEEVQELKDIADPTLRAQQENKILRQTQQLVGHINAKNRKGHGFNSHLKKAEKKGLAVEYVKDLQQASLEIKDNLEQLANGMTALIQFEKEAQQQESTAGNDEAVKEKDNNSQTGKEANPPPQQIQKRGTIVPMPTRKTVEQSERAQQKKGATEENALIAKKETASTHTEVEEIESEQTPVDDKQEKSSPAVTEKKAGLTWTAVMKGVTSTLAIAYSLSQLASSDDKAASMQDYRQTVASTPTVLPPMKMFPTDVVVPGTTTQLPPNVFAQAGSAAGSGFFPSSQQRLLSTLNANRSSGVLTSMPSFH